MKPSGCWFASRPAISDSARGGSKWLSVMAWKQESQNHWKG
jgi:hypothetical protein